MAIAQIYDRMKGYWNSWGTCENPLEWIDNYCKGQDGNTPHDIAKKTLVFLSIASNLDQWEIIQKIHSLFRNKETLSSRIKNLKSAFCSVGHGLNWKEVLLGIKALAKNDLHFVFLKYSNALNLPLDLKNRSCFLSSQEMIAAHGSTFATNKPKRIEDGGHHILDASFGWTCLNPKGEFDGFAVSLGDGAGGHFGDAAQDRMIGRASHFGTKSCVRLFSTYHDPEGLKKDLLPVIQAIGKEIQTKAKTEGTTLAGCRAFSVSGGFRIIGFNIGDNMMISWHPAMQELKHLAPSHCSSAGTAFLPDTYKPFEIQIIDTILPEGTFLYLMSDGMHDTLAFKEEEKTYPNQLTYRVRTLTDLATLLKTIPREASSETYLLTILQKSFDGAERIRQQPTTSEIQIGDDFSIIQCHLVKPGFLESEK